jgi:hypothetical protein
MNLQRLIHEICKKMPLTECDPPAMLAVAQREVRELVKDSDWLHKSLAVTMLKMDPEESWRLNELDPVLRAILLAERMVAEAVCASSVKFERRPILVRKKGECREKEKPKRTPSRNPAHRRDDQPA